MYVSTLRDRRKDVDYTDSEVSGSEPWNKTDGNGTALD